MDFCRHCVEVAFNLHGSATYRVVNKESNLPRRVIVSYSVVTTWNSKI